LAIAASQRRQKPHFCRWSAARYSRPIERSAVCRSRVYL